MKNIKTICFILILGLFSCEKSLVELNQDPNNVSPDAANPNLLLGSVLPPMAKSYNELGFGRVGGVMQHTQEDRWKDGHNDYQWNPENWGGWYSILRTNQLIYERAVEANMPFHQGIALTVRGFVFGLISDLWGDAPYSEALLGNSSTNQIIHPRYDSQEVIYEGIIEELKEAAALFASGNTAGMDAKYDLYYGGDIVKWHKFANSLLLRYYMRISDKKPDVARAGIEAVYASGIYLENASDDADMDYLGTVAGESWPTAGGFTADDSDFRRRRPAKTLTNVLQKTDDPRISIWFQDVNCRWVADPRLPVAVDPFIRKNGVLTDREFLTELEYRSEREAGHVYTRHFNPNLYQGEPLDTGLFVGVPHGLEDTSIHNFNPTPGDVCDNQHASLLAPAFRGRSGGILKARLMTASETAFIFAEAALKGWNVGNAAQHYEDAIRHSFDTWGASGFEDFIAHPDVRFDQSLEQLMEQKWVASFTMATQSWFDFRRTGFPELTPGDRWIGPANTTPVLPVRFIYGQNEIDNNTANFEEAVGKMQAMSGTLSPNSQWAKPWLLQGTGQP